MKMSKRQLFHLRKEIVIIFKLKENKKKRRKKRNVADSKFIFTRYYIHIKIHKIFYFFHIIFIFILLIIFYKIHKIKIYFNYF